MKIAGIICAIGFGAVALCGCHKRPAVEALPASTPAPTPISTPTPTPAPTPTPTPAPTSTAVALPTPEKHLSPEGIYYIIKRTSVVTTDGVLGVPVGSQVGLVERLPGKLKVRYKGMSLDVSADFLTRDLDVLDAVLKENQRTVEASSLVPAPNRPAASRNDHRSVPRPTPMVDAARAARAAYQKQISLLNLKLAAARHRRSEISEYNLENRIQDKNSYNISNSNAQIKDLENQIFMLQQEYEKSRILTAD